MRNGAAWSRVANWFAIPPAEWAARAKAPWRWKEGRGGVALGFHYFQNRTGLHNLPLLIVDECNHFVEPVDRGLDMVIISEFDSRS